MKKNQPAGREVRVSSAPERFEIRSNTDGSRTVSGYFATFNTLSSDLGGFRERVAKGAFAQSLRDNPDVICYFNHDSNLILGRVSSGTLSVEEDDRGLKFRVTLPQTSYSSDLISLMERGDVAACSFGFSVDGSDGDTWELVDGSLIRTLVRVRVWEGSIVGVPAYPNTVADLRSCPVDLRARLTRSAITKTVDGVALPSSSFAYVGDPHDPGTWHLPIHFPDDLEKTKTHIVDALARFDQTDGIPKDDKSEVYARIVGAAKAHGIAVAKESIRDFDDFEDDDDDDLRTAHIALLMRRL